MTSKIIVMAIVVAFVAGTLVSGGIAMADGDKLTKLVKECSKIPKTPDKIKPHCELLGMINAIPAADGVGSTYITTETTTIIAGSASNGVAQCDEGDVLLSGGYIFFGADLIVTADQPIPVGADGQGWQVGAVNPDTTDGTIIIKIICASTTP